MSGFLTQAAEVATNILSQLAYLIAVVACLGAALWYARSRLDPTSKWNVRRETEREKAQKGYDEKVALARKTITHALQQRGKLKPELMVAEAIQNRTHYKGRVSDIIEAAGEKIWDGYPSFMHTPHLRMARFAARHISDIRELTEPDYGVVWLSYVLRDVSQYDYTVLHIITELDKVPKSPFADPRREADAQRRAGVIKDRVAAIAQVRLAAEESRRFVIVNSDMTDDQKGLELKKIDEHEANEVDKLNRNLGLVE